MSTTIRVGARPARKRAQAFTRHHQVDTRFATLLSEDFSIETRVILDALEGEPQKTAIALYEWASEKTDDPAFALTAWAKKYGKGRCRGTARTTTKRPARRHGSPGADRADDGRGSGPARRGGIDPAFIRANLSKMGD